MITDIQKLDTGLLPSEDLRSLQELYPEIRHDWEVKPIFRTETEARISVLNEIHFPAPHGKYWQCVREQQVHFNELVYLSFDYRRRTVELRKLKTRLEKETNPDERELLEIDLEQKQYEILSCEKVAAERVRELKQWHKIKTELVTNHGKEIDTEDCDCRQLKSYTKAFILEMLNSGPNIGAADAQNIIGKAVTAKNRCKELGIWEEVRVEMGLNENHLKALGE